MTVCPICRNEIAQEDLFFNTSFNWYSHENCNANLKIILGFCAVGNCPNKRCGTDYCENHKCASPDCNRLRGMDADKFGTIPFCDGHFIVFRMAGMI